MFCSWTLSHIILKLRRRRRQHTYLVSGEQTEVKGGVGDDVSLGSLSHGGHHLVSQSEHIGLGQRNSYYYTE